jgi:hypothetical protein
MGPLVVPRATADIGKVASLLRDFPEAGLAPDKRRTCWRPCSGDVGDCTRGKGEAFSFFLDATDSPVVPLLLDACGDATSVVLVLFGCLVFAAATPLDDGGSSEAIASAMVSLITQASSDAATATLGRRLSYGRFGFGALSPVPSAISSGDRKPLLIVAGEGDPGIFCPKVV